MAQVLNGLRAKEWRRYPADLTHGFMTIGIHARYPLLVSLCTNIILTIPYYLWLSSCFACVKTLSTWCFTPKSELVPTCRCSNAGKSLA
jgi:hypothetical protein